MTHNNTPDQPAAGNNVRLELTWPNKDKFLLTPSGDDGKPVWVDRGHPAAGEVRLATVTGSHGDTDTADPYGQNLLFTGDSLDVLRILTRTPEYADQYRGKVRLVYIDPPFNTGQTFTHYDDWMEHSTWLSFMRERLLLIRDLLAEDGSVWVHLDDSEVHRMRCLMDEVFGAQNFVGSFAWQRSYGGKNSSKFMVADHDTILAFARDKKVMSWNRLPRTERQNAVYKNPDGDPRGPWTAGDYTAKSGGVTTQYEIEGPSGQVLRPPPGKYWGFSESSHRENVKTGRVWWGKDGTNRKPAYKRFLSEVPDILPHSWLQHTDVGHNSEAKKELKALFPGVTPFSTPKPERLLERVIHIASNPGDFVVDVFGGSGTTAAVAHKMGRRWVTAELNPDIVRDFTRPRLVKVVDGADPGGVTDKHEWAGGGGFVDVTVGPSMYEMTPVGVLLADWATNGEFARAVAAQLGFTFQPDDAPLCGVRGRLRLAVFDGAVGEEEAREVVDALEDGERAVVVGKTVLPGAEQVLVSLSRGSRVLKAPRDLLAGGRH